MGAGVDVVFKLGTTKRTSIEKVMMVRSVSVFAILLAGVIQSRTACNNKTSCQQGLVHLYTETYWSSLAGAEGEAKTLFLFGATVSAKAGQRSSQGQFETRGLTFLQQQHWETTKRDHCVSARGFR